MARKSDEFNRKTSHDYVIQIFTELGRTVHAVFREPLDWKRLGGDRQSLITTQNRRLLIWLKTVFDKTVNFSCVK